MNILDHIVQRETETDDVKVMQNLKNAENLRIPLVMWGCGEVAERVYIWLNKNNIKLSGVFIDGNPGGLIFHGIEVVCGLNGICEKYRTFNVIIAHKNGYASGGALKNRCENIADIYALEMGVLYPVEPVDIDFIVKNIESFQCSYDYLSDELSQKSYLAYLNAKINKSYKGLDLYLSEPQYFCEDIIKFTPDEVFVDCGAYDGDSVLSFAGQIKSRPGSGYEAVYAFEPDDINFAKLSALSPEIKNLHCIKKGAWDKRDLLQFNSEGTGMSAIRDAGNIVIETDTIDGVLQGRRASFIKMDIEGSELNALKGAEKTIKKYKPRLVVSAYHKACDLIKIPQYIKSLVPEYKLYFRLHKYGTIDSVIYAV